MATGITLAVFALLLVSAQIMESHRLYDVRVSLLQSIDEAAAYYGEETSGHLTREAEQRLAATAIKGMRYQAEAYLFITDMTLVMIMHPIKPELDNRNVAALADPAAFRLFSAMADVVRAHGEGIVPYLWPGRERTPRCRSCLMSKV